MKWSDAELVALQNWAMVPVCLLATACPPGPSRPEGIPLIVSLEAAAKLLERTLQDVAEGRGPAADILQVQHSHPQSLLCFRICPLPAYHGCLTNPCDLQAHLQKLHVSAEESEVRSLRV